MSKPKVRGFEIPQKIHKILVVDDDDTVLQLVSKFLKRRGHDVEVAQSGEDCIRKLGDFEPEIVLLDFNLPGMNGLQTLRQIRASHRGGQITVVLVTAQTDKDLVKSSLALGIDDFIVKPFSLEAMASRLEKHFLDIDTHSVREMLRHLPVIDENLVDHLPFKEGSDKKQWSIYPLFREEVPFAIAIQKPGTPSETARLEDADLLAKVMVFVKRTQWKQIWPSPDLAE